MIRAELKTHQRAVGQLTTALQALNGNYQTRVLSKDARNRIAEAQRARWARTRRASGKMTTKKGPALVTKPHWTQTPAGRKRMADIQRARHAETK